MRERTPAAKAEHGGVIYGTTTEAVPFYKTHAGDLRFRSFQHC
jgi:hypothetical protein